MEGWLLDLQLACPGLFLSMGFYCNFGAIRRMGPTLFECPKLGLVNASVVAAFFCITQTKTILSKIFVKELRFAPARNFKIASSRVIEPFSSLLTIIFKSSIRFMNFWFNKWSNLRRRIFIT